MMFEPLLKALHLHGDNLQQKLCEIRDHLGSIVENTQAQIATNQWVRKSVEVPKEASEQLRNNEAYGWLIRDVAATSEVEIFVNNENGSGFVCKLAAGERDNVHWYVPPGSIVFVKNLSEKETGFTNLHIELLVTTAEQASTGSTEEHIDVPRDPTTPSGHPLRM